MAGAAGIANVAESDLVLQAHSLEAAVIGAGPAGLAAAACLRERGVESLVIERSGFVGASWRSRYDNLHLNTVRWLSHLPGLRVPRSYGRWPGRDAFVRYLEAYAAHHRLRIRFETSVERVERDGDDWLMRSAQVDIRAAHVVIATGMHHAPRVPSWPGRDTFTGELIHSASYRNPSPYREQDVLVVGTGDSGSGIALDLAKNGARRVWISVRTSPNIFPGERLGIPAQVQGLLARRLPGRIVDRISLMSQRFSVGDLSKYGLPPPTKGVYTRATEDNVGPVVDFGFVDALKRRKIEAVGIIERFEGPDVVLAGGRRVRPAAVIAATGYGRALDGLVGHLGVLGKNGLPEPMNAITSPKAPGLYFIGFRTNSFSGAVHEMGSDAKAIAKQIASAKRESAERRRHA